MNDKWKNLGNRLSAAWSRPVKPSSAARFPLSDVNSACKDLRAAYNKSCTIDNTSEFPLSFHIPPLKGHALFMRVCPFSFGPSRASAILYRWMQKSEICTATLDVAS